MLGAAGTELLHVKRCVSVSGWGLACAGCRSITEMIVSNESRLGNSLVVRNFANPRQFSPRIQVKYDDLPKVGCAASGCAPS